MNFICIKINKPNMISTEMMMMSILLFGQCAQCILSSRCTKISSPCCSIERDVLPADEVVQQIRERNNSQPKSYVESIEDVTEPRP